MRIRKSAAAAFALSLVLGACTSDSSTTPGTSGPSGNGTNLATSARIERIRQQVLDGNYVFATSLKAVGDCNALLSHIQAEAGARVGPYGLPSLYGEMFTAAGGPVAMATATGAAGRASSEDSLSGKAATAPTVGVDYSGTNNQESGVDEPDIVKSDGKRIVTITGNKLSVIAVNADGTTNGALRQVSIGNANFTPSQLLIVGDRAVVLGSAYGSGGVIPMRGGVASSVASDIAYPGGGTTATVTEVDLSGTGAPKVGATLKVEGAYLTARLVGTTMRLVLSSTPDQLPFVSPQNQAGEERARKSNEQVVLDSTLDDWLPNYELTDANGKVTKGLLTDCANVDAPSEFAGFGSLSVLTFDLTKSLDAGHAVSVLAGADTVYASDTDLYVATQTWIDPEQQSNTRFMAQWQNKFSTSIHAFSIEGTAPAKYLASGTVPGYLLNQFSMSEYNDVLRVATTKGMPWNSQETSESLLTTLHRKGDKLEQLGQVGDMGRGERIYSVRFDGPAAYLVTFRQTDPFYTLDLTNPAAPKVVGELKITGYSGYLHPIGDNLVIGVGQEATTQGRTQGAKVSLFDVSDLANPKELAKWTSNDWAQTGVEWDHHAFTWWAPTKQLVLPLMSYASGTQFMGAVVLHVDRDGIVEQGRISHAIERPANLGQSDCHTLTAAELAAWATGPVGDTGINGQGVSVIALVCAPNQVGGAIGYQCNVLSSEALENTSQRSKLEVPQGGHVEICWPSWNQPQPIQRSLVIGSSLWTMSAARLQANTLATLALTARVDL